MKKNRLAPSPLCTLQQARSVYDACHDFLTDQSGPYPSWKAVRKAYQENRLRIIDMQEKGSLEIIGDNACMIQFQVD